jgi:hypothetical protein
MTARDLEKVKLPLSKSTIARNLDAGERTQGAPERPQPVSEALPRKGDRASVIAWKPEDGLNKTELRYLAMLRARYDESTIGIQDIRLRLSKSLHYTPDLYLIDCDGGDLRIVFWEVKGPHRFRREGITRVKMAARLYPQFDFWLCEWDGREWKETLLSKI